MIRIQPLRLGLSPLCRFISTWAFETQGQTLLAIESVNTFMIIPPALPPEHDVNSAVAIVDPGFGDLGVARCRLPPQSGSGKSCD
ncbi:Uncharacterised protein [Cedecea lapagei]|uniref:Uncharacterized protein n=1 Tax=Cedecea lapagei TaxID=158823 RepID=A0A3S5DPG6_9ENTR|nr:Uncharacterised protein [Cedecea lapagei]